MSSVTSVATLFSDAYPSSTVSPASAEGRSSAPRSGAEQADTVELSPAALRQGLEAGRIALNLKEGNLTSDQATQLYQQVASIHSQIVADKQADGGTLSSQDAQTIAQLQSQLSATIYSDAHDGAAPPSDATVTIAGLRTTLQTGRIVINEHAGNLSGTQTQKLLKQQAAIETQIAADKQANGGSLTPDEARTINQLQDRVSAEISQLAHSNNPASEFLS